MYFVYVLIDPRDNEVRYVGMTSDIYTRFSQHLRCDGNAIQPVYEQCDTSHLKGVTAQQDQSGTITIEVASNGEWMITVQELE